MSTIFVSLKKPQNLSILLGIAAAVCALISLLPGENAQGKPPYRGKSVSVHGKVVVGSSADATFLALVAGDLDNDGDQDLITGSNDEAAYELMIWENSSNPFNPSWTHHNLGTVSTDVFSLAMGDVDNDGDLDLVSGRGWGGGAEVNLWQNDGTPFDGVWSMNDVGPLSGQVNSVDFGDVDGDGDLDIVSGLYGMETYKLSLWQNDGSPFSGNWAQVDIGATTGDIRAAVFGDLDHDGDLDIASSSSGLDDNVVVWQNDGTPFNGLWGSKIVGDNQGARTLTVGDLNEDGYLDIVSGGSPDKFYNIQGWTNPSNPFTEDWGVIFNGWHTADIFAVALGDMDNDSDLDILSGCDAGASRQLVIWENRIDQGVIVFNSDLDFDGAIYDLILPDLDGDDDLDIGAVIESGDDHQVVIWKNTRVRRSMPFNPSGSAVGASTTSVNEIASGDLDNDGDTDVVAVTTLAEDFEVIAWRNDGTPFDGVWFQNDVGASTTSVQAVTLGDLDRDGKLDIVTGRTPTADFEINIWQNDGTPFNGLWTAGDVGESATTVSAVAVGDLDNDGKPDIVTGRDEGTGYELIAWQNDGTPFNNPWTPNNIGGTAASVTSLALGDLDLDGDLDLASGCQSGEDYEVIIWQNDGTPFGGLWGQVDVGTSGASVLGLALGQVFKNGYLDILSGSHYGNPRPITAWQNSTDPFVAAWTPIWFGEEDSSIQALAPGDVDGDGWLDVVGYNVADGTKKLYIYQNDRTPGDGGWTELEIGSVETTVHGLSLADLDLDGDLDALTGFSAIAGYELMAWENWGGSAKVTAADSAPSSIQETGMDDILRIDVKHNGIPEDHDLELAQLDLKFRTASGDPFIGFYGFLEKLHVYRSNDTTWESTDSLVGTIEFFNVEGDALVLYLPDEQTDAQVVLGFPRTYFVVIELAPTAATVLPEGFRVLFDPDDQTIVEDRTTDAAVSIEDTVGILTKLITIDPLPATATPTPTTTPTPTSTPTPTATLPSTPTADGENLYLPLVCK